MRSSAEVKQQRDYWLKDLHNSMVELLMFLMWVLTMEQHLDMGIHFILKITVCTYYYE